MEKVTVYGSVRPGRGERLPRVDFSESSRSDFPLPLDRDVPGPQQTQRRSTRLLPNLRYLPPYDEDRPDERRAGLKDCIRPSLRQNCQASVYEDFGYQHEQVQSRSSASYPGRSEAPLGTVTIGRKSALIQTAAAPPTRSSSTALSKKVAASNLFLFSNTMSTVIKHKPHKLLQKPTLATLPRPKHKKTLTGGRQIKTHLRCEHLSLGPVWGGGAPCAQQEQRPDDSLTKREAFERHRIARKIDALCAASARRGPAKEDMGGYDEGKGKRSREEEGYEEEGSPPAAKHNKLMASGRQHKTLLCCQHLPDQRRLQARPVPAVAVEGHDEEDVTLRSRQRHMVPSNDGTNDDDDDHVDCDERLRNLTNMGDMGSNRKKVVLKSNIRTPRRSFGNIYEEAGSHLAGQETGTQSAASSSYGAADADSNAVPPRESSYKNCDCWRGRSSRYISSDCQYCREDTNHSLRTRCKLCANMGCSHNSPDDVGATDPKHARSSPFPDHPRNAVDEHCPVCQRKSTSLKDGGRCDFSKGYYQNACHFCGMVFGRSDLPVVSNHEHLLYGSCDHHYGSSRPDSRHYGDRPQRPERQEQGGHLGWAAADRERTTRGAGLRDGRPQTSRVSEESSRRDRDEWSSVSEGGRRHQDAPLGGQAEGRFPPVGRPNSLRRGSRGEKSSKVSFSDYSDGDTNAVNRDKRTYHENPITNDVRDSSVGPSRRRPSVGDGILKNSTNTPRVTYSNNLLQNADVNSESFMAPRDQLRSDYRQRNVVGARKSNPVSSDRSRIIKQSHGVRSMSREENRLPSLPRGAGKIARVKRDLTHSLVLEDHL